MKAETRDLSRVVHLLNSRCYNRLSEMPRWLSGRARPW